MNEPQVEVTCSSCVKAVMKKISQKSAHNEIVMSSSIQSCTKRQDINVLCMFYANNVLIKNFVRCE